MPPMLRPHAPPRASAPTVSRTSIHLGWDVLLIAGLIVADIVAISKRALLLPIPIAVTAAVNCVCVGAIVIYAMSPWPIQPFVYFRF